LKIGHHRIAAKGPESTQRLSLEIPFRYHSETGFLRQPLRSPSIDKAGVGQAFIMMADSRTNRRVIRQNGMEPESRKLKSAWNSKSVSYQNL